MRCAGVASVLQVAESLVASVGCTMSGVRSATCPARRGASHTMQMLRLSSDRHGSRLSHLTAFTAWAHTALH